MTTRGRAFILSLVVVGVLAAAAPAGAAERWINGQQVNVSGANCTGGTATMSSFVGYRGDPEAGTPRVGDVYWASVLMGIGPVCNTTSGVYTDIAVTLPPGTELAVDAQHKVNCWSQYKSETRKEVACPRLRVEGQRVIADRSEFPNNYVFEIYLPLRSTSPLAGSAGNHRLSAEIDMSHATARMNPTGWVWVWDTTSGGGGGGDTGAPTWRSAPTLVGNPVAGETIGCYKGGWTGQVDTVKWEWVMMFPGLGNRQFVVDAVTGNVHGISLELPANAGGATVWCRQTISSSAGSATSESRRVSVLAQWPEIVLFGNVVILGTPRLGEVLRCDSGRYQWVKDTPPPVTWFRDGTPIAGAADPSYTVTAADEGHDLHCSVRYANPVDTETRQSAPVRVDAAAPPEPPPPVTTDPPPVTTDPPPPPTDPPAGETPRGNNPPAAGGGDARPDPAQPQRPGDEGSRPPADTAPPTVALRGATKLRLRALLRKGLSVRFECSEACGARARVTLTGRKPLLLATTTRRVGPGTGTLRLKLTRAAKRKLRRVRSAKLAVTVTVTDAAGNTGPPVTRRITLRR